MARTISDIYQEYDIMPGLQQHMLRVAGVAKIICDSLPRGEVVTNDVVKACLLHDMGNIVKSDLRLFPEILGDRGEVYWQAKKQEVIIRYGNTPDLATKAILIELGVTATVIELVSAIGVPHLEATYLSQDIQKAICEYADLRVTPWGVATLSERVA
ncbi:MAG: HD domain-containing protein, partial [bacterium]|nr:HD domain-containing protein [bacterium]